MPVPTEFSFLRYLAAKKSVDDRALNRHVAAALRAAVQRSSADPLRVLEVGAGIGAMVERCVEWDLLPGNVYYTAIDHSAGNTAALPARLSLWAESHGFTIKEEASRLSLTSRSPRGAARRLLIEVETADVFDLLERPQAQGAWDVLIAHAFLDLIDIGAALRRLLALLAPGGLFYFTINFDGLTILEPVIDAVYDQEILSAYHQTMDARIVAGRPSGDSQAGRRLFDHLWQAGGDILAAGSSDWVVFPHAGQYPEDEAYFLHFIVHTMDVALRDHRRLEASRFHKWIAQRHAQIERGELVYIAHQLDFVGRIST